MVDMSAVAGLTSSLKAISDIAKALISIRDAQMVQSKIGELLGEIVSASERALAAQAAQAELAERVRELERAQLEAENWAAEQQRYQLVEVGRGCFAYKTKEAMRGDEPAHHICPACMQKRQKLILQSSSTLGGRDLTCPACHLRIYVPD